MFGLIIGHSCNHFPNQFELGNRILREYLTLKSQAHMLIPLQLLLLVISVRNHQRRIFGIPPKSFIKREIQILKSFLFFFFSFNVTVHLLRVWKENYTRKKREPTKICLVTMVSKKNFKNSLHNEKRNNTNVI